MKHQSTPGNNSSQIRKKSPKPTFPPNEGNLRCIITTFSIIFWLAMACLSIQQSCECFRKFLQFKIVEDVDVDTQKPVLMPAITICPFPGLRVLNDTTQDGTNSLNVAQLCPNRTDYANCLQEYLYSRQDLVVGGLSANQFELDEGFWQPAPLSFSTGACYTYLATNSTPVGNSYVDTTLEFDVSNKNNISLNIFIHNTWGLLPCFGLTLDGGFLPQTFLSIDTQSKQLTSAFVSVGRRNNMNTEEKPCLVDASYNPIGCYHQYLSEKLRCQLPWQLYQPQNFLNNCSTKEDFQNFLDLNIELFWITSAAFIEETGCHPPCSYDTYDTQVITNHNEVIGDGLMSAYHNQSNSALVVTLRTSAKTVVTETYLYDTSSLVGELGGSLGLFLGVSFATVPSIVTLLAKYFMFKLGEAKRGNIRAKNARG